MRFSGAVLGVLGFGSTVLGQGAAGPKRGAVLLPPQPADPPVVARAAAEELPAFPGSTPVNRGPARPGRTDPSVRPAGGTQPNLTIPTPPPRPEPTALAKGIDKLKGAFAAEKPAPAPAPAPTPDAATAFRSTSATGQPVYAGPPAYRWYGWGSVTPGGNPFAPAGQYPRASAHWHSITGATPGAFPVPVADPTRSPPGAEPPAYAAAPRTPPPAAPPPPARPLAVVPTPTPEPPYLPPTPAPVKPVPTPTLTLAPLLPRPADPAPAAPLPALPVLPPVTVPAAGVEPPKPAAGEPTPWQPSTGSAPAGGDWTPGGR